MPWVKIDDGFAEHPKVEEVGPMAGFLHVAALCYCNRNLTDGFVPSARVPKLADIPSVQKHVKALVRVGMWLEEDGGYRLHDYLEYQPSKAKVEAEREDAKKRMAALRAAKKSKGQSDPGPDPFDDDSDEVLDMFGRTDPERSGEVRSTRPHPADSSSHLSTRLRAVPMAIEAMGLVPGYESAGGASA